ncbi:MAG: VCBS repeat-containing protein [Verrucomicrobiales bacterium]|nr:VCBS repeat-containing protein [Verrucomicrobiales bacterium]
MPLPCCPKPYSAPAKPAMARGSAIVLGCLALVAAAGGVSRAAADGFRTLTVPTGGRTGFELLPPERTGLAFTNTLSPANAAANQIRLNGSGVALGDVNGDGLCDIYACALEGENRLFLNRGGWRFEAAGAEAGVACAGQYSTGAAFAEVDGDGDLDLLVLGIGRGARLFRNDGQGRFTAVTGTELVAAYGATSCAFGDVDGDGDLDLYVANYRTDTVRTTGFSLLNVDGRRMVMPQDRRRLEITPEGRVLEHGEPDFLYLNDGQGGFRMVPWTQGTFLDENGEPLKQAPLDWGLTCAFRDLNGDGAPDLYVCNDFHSPDRIWINDGRGRFRAIDRMAIRHTATFAMAADFADVDRDGWDDLLVSDMTSRSRARRLMQIAGMDPYTIAPGVFDDRPQLDRTVLQWNRGDGSYAEVACYAGLENSEWNWSVLFLDVDLDGYEDVLATTGHLFDTQDLDAQERIQAAGPYTRETMPGKLLMLPPLEQANLAFRNRGDLTFAEAGGEWGFDQVGVSQGMALGDLDNDGDLDLVVNNLNAPLGVYRNTTSAPRVAVRLRGRAPNPAGIGARITVSGGPVTQSQEMMAGGRYLSGDEALRVFAAGSDSRPLRIEVRWPRGGTTVVDEVQPNRLYEIAEPAGNAGEDRTASPRNDRSAERRVWFEDISERISHPHPDVFHDDFARQPLLPRRLSQLGPGIGWFDLDGDGRDDLFIGSGRGGRLAAFHNHADGTFSRLSGPPWDQPVTRDQTTLLGWRNPAGQAALLVGSASYEDGLALGAAVREYASGTPQVRDPIPAGASSAGPLALADYDGDGDLDLFVGGRTVPGRYPEPASSQLWRWEARGWKPDEVNAGLLERVGLVSGAVWTDLDGDGFPELVLAGEWGPLRIFRNQRGRLAPWNPALRGAPGRSLDELTGWWNGVNAGDFDGDGRLDLLAANWGLNTVHHASVESPLSVYHGDFDESGIVNLIEAVRDPATGRDLPDRDLNALAAAIPSLRGRFPTHAAFGRATVADLLETLAPPAGRLEVNWLASILLLNRGDHFELVRLPREAGFAPAFAVAVGDLDGDGNEDAFLSQNFFATHDRTPRCDAGLGLLLRGDGRGGLSAVPVAESGIRIHGEQRGAALADFDGDGRTDLAVTQNAAATRLFRNTAARPGLRVRLAGPPGNPEGVGAVLRLRARDVAGPARELHAGAGYWSQDSAVTVLARPAARDELWIRWPGGRETVSPVPDDARSITVRADGNVDVNAP